MCRPPGKAWRAPSLDEHPGPAVERRENLECGLPGTNARGHGAATNGTIRDERATVDVAVLLADAPGAWSPGALLVAGDSAEVGSVVVGGGVHEERSLRARAVFLERDAGGHFFQVASRPFAQDLAEPVEALVPDGGDEVE